MLNLNFDLFCSPITFGLSFIFNLKKSLKLLYLALVTFAPNCQKKEEYSVCFLNVNDDVNKAFPDTFEELLRLQGLLTSYAVMGLVLNGRRIPES